MKIEVGKKYTVTNSDNGTENGNVIEIIYYFNGYYYYKTVKGIERGPARFTDTCAFARGLRPHAEASGNTSTYATGDTLTLKPDALEVTSVQRKPNGEFMYAVKGGFRVPQGAVEGGKVEPIKPQDKPVVADLKYKAGGKVKVVGNGCYHGYKTGAILTLKSPDMKYCHLYGTGRSQVWFVHEGQSYVSVRDIEPYTAPVPEPVTLWCKKDRSYHKLTKGNLYTFTSGEAINFDTGKCGVCSSHKTYDKFLSAYPDYAENLVRTEKRPAKVGEWILPLYANDFHGPAVDKTRPVRVDSVDKTNIRVRAGLNWFRHNEYLVLVDYKPEPEYLNATVVCYKKGITSTQFTQFKQYKVANGIITTDAGIKHGPYKTVEELNSNFASQFALSIPADEVTP